MRKSFTWFLSLMVLLFAFAAHGYAQEEQKTVELYAEKASSCYLESNDYTVNIAVRDFIKLTKFELGLSFNDDIYTFVGLSAVNAGLSALTTSITPVALGPDVLNLNWSGGPVSIGDNLKTDVIKLHFKLKGFPANTAVTFPTDLKWSKANFYYTALAEEKVNTSISTNGSLMVNVSHSGIETELSTEGCAGGDVMVKVTAPDAAFYLFNEDPVVALWDWQTSNQFLAKAGERVTIRVKSADGCMSLMDEVLIPETVDSVRFTVTPQDVLCYGEQGRITVNATGGIAPYTYWVSSNADGSGAKQKLNFQFSADPGTYYVSVQDANGCAVVAPWKEVTVKDNNVPIIITPTITDVLCYGNATGSIAVSVSGGATEVSLDKYTWKALVGGVYTFNNMPATNYTVWARNENGCVVELKDVVVTQPEGPITFDIEIVDTSCGGEDDGMITVVDVTGGTEPYTYSLDGIDFTNTTGVFPGLEPIYYSLWVRDANGCTVAYANPNKTGNRIAVQSPDDIRYEVVVTGPLCNDGPAKVAITSVTGGTGKYKFTFDDGATWVDTMTIDVWNAPYTLPGIWVANEDLTCAVEYGTEWGATNPDVLFAAVVGTLAPTCIDSKDGDIQLQINGGVAPYWYSLNGGAWKKSDGEFTSLKVPVGTHEIAVKDANGCETELLIQDITLEENVIAAASDGRITCFGDKVGTISVTINSWAEAPDYTRSKTWMIENSAGVVSAFTPSNVGGTATKFNAGTYYVWGVDQYTCVSNRDTVVIRENPELKIDDVIANGASCFNVSNGAINIYASGGTVDGLLEYAFVDEKAAKLDNLTEDKWLKFDSYDPLTTKSQVTFNVNGGTYWVAVRDNGCDEVSYGPIEVVGYKKLLVNETMITYADPLCYESMDGTITVPTGAVSGGAQLYLFTLLEWVGAGDGPGTWVEKTGYKDLATGDFTGLDEGTYKVLVEDTEGCPSYTTKEIELINPAELMFDTDFTHFSCEGSNDGIITINIDGGTPDYWYAVNNPNAWVFIGKDKTEKTYIATEPGMFILWVKDANGCITAPDTVYILEPSALSAEVTVDNNVSCNGAPAPDGQITVKGIGGWEGMTLYSYKVNNGAWTSGTNMPYTIPGLPAGTHTLHIRDVAGHEQPYQSLDCEYSVEFTITQPKPITYDVIVQDVKCKDGEDGTLTVNILSGTGTPWNFPLTPSLSGYDVWMTGDNYNSDTVRTGADFSHTFTDLPHSHYTVYIKDKNGCVLKPTIGNSTSPYTTIESWEVNEPATYLTLDPEWISDVTCFDGEDGEFILHADGGTPGYKYHTELSTLPTGHLLVEPKPGAVWQDSPTFNVGVGTWVVWVMDDNGCVVGGERDVNGDPVNKWRVKVGQPDSLVWAFHTVTVGNKKVKHYVQPKCYGDWNGEIHLVDIAGGTAKYNAHASGTSAAGEPVDLTWSNILKGSDGIYKLTGVPASDKFGFNVTVTDAKGCTSVTDTILVKQPAQLAVSLEESPDNYTCFGAVEGWIEATATGGTAPYSYQLLKNGAVHTSWQKIASAFLVQVGNEFTVEVRDANGCMTSAVLDMPTPLEINFTAFDLSCRDDEKASVKITATGTPGREFHVWYREIGEAIANPGPFIKYNGSFTESIVVNDVFKYDNENYIDRHYDVYVQDDHGCVSARDTLTFDQVQTVVTMTLTSTDVTECSETFTVGASGGVGSNYQVMVGESVVTGMSVTLPRGIHTITVMDEHMCAVEQTVEVVGEYVTSHDTLESYIGEETAYVNAEAGIDTMFAEAGSHSFVYMVGDCERTLELVVVKVARPYAIAAVQGEGDASPIVGKIAKITGTVTGVASGEGFFVQDAVAAWSGIWVEYSDVTTDGIKVGDGVEVVGSVIESSSVTTLVATDVEVITAPLAITALPVEPSAAKAEMYESVLVKIAGARAEAVNTANGEWNIYYTTANSIIVNDWLFAYTPKADDFYDVTGVVNGRLDAFKLEPRMTSDVVNVTETAVKPELANAFKVYPNPFNEKITIENNDKLVRVVISNIAGQRVIDVEYPEREIRTQSLVSGVYLVNLFTEKGLVKTERLVKR